MTRIPRFCVIVGANGTGKSTLFGAIAFLKECMTYNVYSALEKLGGFHEVISRGASEETIALELQIRMDIAGKSRLVTYSLDIRLKDGRPYIHEEFLRYKRGAYGHPYNFLKFSNGQGYAVNNEEDFSKEDKELKCEDQALDNNTILAIKGLGQFERFKAARALRQLIENWHISDFHIDAARGSKEDSGYDDHLSETGDNLQRVAFRLYENEEKILKNSGSYGTFGAWNFKGCS